MSKMKMRRSRHRQERTVADLRCTVEVLAIAPRVACRGPRRGCGAAPPPDISLPTTGAAELSLVYGFNVTTKAVTPCVTRYCRGRGTIA